MEPAEAAPAVRVVGVALVAPDPPGPRVLAARRPAGAGDGWELPGGKCLPAEPLHVAAVREIHEELGCWVRVTGRLQGRQPIRDGLTLEVVVARLEAGRPQALEHEELRWLTAAELAGVSWLPADEPFLPQLRDLLEGLR